MISIPDQAEEALVPFGELMRHLDSMNYRNFDHEWVAALTEALIDEFGYDDPEMANRAGVWVHRTLQPVLCLVRLKYREKMGVKTISIKNHRKLIDEFLNNKPKIERVVHEQTGIQSAHDYAPHVGDRVFRRDFPDRSTYSRTWKAMKKSPLFIIVRPEDGSAIYAKRVKE